MDKRRAYCQLQFDFEKSKLVESVKATKVTAKDISEKWRPDKNEIIAFTYGLVTMRRTEAMEKAARKGWRVADRITADTTVLVTGSRKRVGKSNKIRKAEKYGVKIINEVEFAKLLGIF